jgi:hypothetical protein
MDHLTGPLEQLRDRAAAFMRRGGLRLLHVVADDLLVPASLDLLCGLEWLPDAHGPVVRLEEQEPAAGPALNWSAWTAAIRAEHVRLAEECQRGEISMVAPLLANGGEAIGAFASALKTFADACAGLPQPPRGVVVLLSPGRLPDAKAWMSNLEGLVTSPSLKSARWIWVETGGNEGAALVERLSSQRATTVVCRVNEARRAAEIDGLLDGMAAAAAAGDTSRGTLRTGAAGPAAGFPPHPTDPPTDPPARAGAGAPPMLDGAVLAPLIAAVKAVSKGDINAALPLQREARDRAIERGLTAESVQMELLLATYAAQACFESHVDPKQAIDVFASASARAQATGLPLFAAIAELGAGTIASLAKDGQLAARSFMKAADLAGKAGAPELRTEALRAAGRLAADAGLKERAASLFDQAEKDARPSRPTDEAKPEAR